MHREEGVVGAYKRGWINIYETKFLWFSLN